MVVYVTVVILGSRNALRPSSRLREGSVILLESYVRR